MESVDQSMGIRIGEEAAGDLFDRYGEVISRGTVLFYEGDPGQEMYIILSGKVRISKEAGGLEKVLVVLGKGEFFGEMAILNNKPRSATATVIEDCRILIIDRETFETMIRSNGEIAVRIIKKLAARLQEADNQIENLLLRDNMSRLVNHLQRKALEAGAPATGEYCMPFLPEDLASEAGISGHQLEDLLKKLKSAKMVQTGEGEITIVKMEVLERFSKYLEMKDQFCNLT